MSASRPACSAATRLNGSSPGGGTGQPVKIFELNSNGTVGNLIESRKVFAGRGVFVAAGDVNNDGRAELIVGAGSGTPNVEIYSDTDLDGQLLDNRVDSFLAFPSGFRGGVQVAAGNTNNTAGAEVITASASAGRRIKIWTDADLDAAVSDGPVLEDATVYSSSFKGGVNVATGEIVSIGGPGAELDDCPRRRQGEGVHPHGHGRGRQGVLRHPAFESGPIPDGSGWNKGVRVAAGDTDHSGFFVELVTAPGALAGSKKDRIYDDGDDAGAFLHDNPVAQEFRAMPGSVSAGAYVAVGRAFAATYMSLQAPRAIPDGGTTTSDVLVPASAGRIQSMSVALNIPHTFAADLDVTLTHMASGTSLSLFSDVGDVANGFLVSLNDFYPTDIGTFVPGSTNASVAGAFNPEGAAALTTFNRTRRLGGVAADGHGRRAHGHGRGSCPGA